MIEREQIQMMIYQHALQLTVAGASVQEAFSIAYAVAAEAFDDESHASSMKHARERLGQRRVRSDEKDRPKALPTTKGS